MYRTTALGLIFRNLGDEKVGSKIQTQFIYNLEVVSSLLGMVLASQPALIFWSLFLRHGKRRMLLQAKTTSGRRTAIMKVGGVYHKNWPMSIHLFHANTAA